MVTLLYLSDSLFEQDHRAGNMDGIEIIHILIGHVRDDDAIEEFILHGFELFFGAGQLYMGQRLNELFYFCFMISSLDTEGDTGQVVDTKVCCPVESNGVAVLLC
mgnify:CR=1 FL=1